MRFFVTFEKSFDLVVDAESVEALGDALDAMSEHEIDDVADWGGDTWDRHASVIPHAKGKADCVVVDGKLLNADDVEAAP